MIVFFITMYIVGIFTSIHAVMSTRTSQGAIAWAVSAITFPYLAVPAYWVFGRSKFDSYNLLRFSDKIVNSDIHNMVLKYLESERLLAEPRTHEDQCHLNLLDRISKLPTTTGNQAQLLIDGQQTFDAILAEIQKAKEYILFQFYILREDDLGQRVKQALLDKAKQGVRVYVLYDEIGSPAPSRQYCDDFRSAGAEIFPFNANKGSRFRINFRNHRKIVIVDGKVAFVGGHNVGDEYLGKHPKLTPWRDTHVALRGPVVQCVQVPFVEDWNWATDVLLSDNLKWIPDSVAEPSMVAACIPTGPADHFETGTLWFLHQINAAEKRLWIVSPYFVPDEQLLSALQLAALRGVDVRVIIPQNPDHWHVYLASFSYLQEVEAVGVKVYRYQPGFLHQKVVLIDDNVSCIGTANLDNRSMRLNFEITALIVDEPFAREVEKMLLNDLSECKPSLAIEYTERSFLFRLVVRIARLFAPIL